MLRNVALLPDQNDRDKCHVCSSHVSLRLLPNPLIRSPIPGKPFGLFHKQLGFF